MEMMIAAGKTYTRETLVAEILAKFGRDTRFHTCSAENMTAEQMVDFLAQRGKLAGSGVHALNVLRHYGRSQPDRAARYAPPGEEGAQLRSALAEYHHCPDPPFSGTTLGNNDYSAIEDGFMRSSPKLAVIDNFLSPAADRKSTRLNSSH